MKMNGEVANFGFVGYGRVAQMHKRLQNERSLPVTEAHVTIHTKNKQVGQ